MRNSIRLPDKKDPKLAELIGILLGDGCISESYQNRIQITLNSNELDYGEYIRKLFNNLFDIMPILKFRKKERAIDIQVFSKDLVRFLIDKVGLLPSPKWERAKLPKTYLAKGLRRYVLRGYFDTDGSVVIANNNGTPYPRLEMKICPSPMRDTFVGILRKEGFRFGAYAIENNRTRIQMNGKNQATKWLINIGFSNPIHIQKYDKIKW